MPGLHPQPVIEAIGRVFAGVKQELVEDEEADGDEPMEAEGEEAEVGARLSGSTTCMYVLYVYMCCMVTV